MIVTRAVCDFEGCETTARLYAMASLHVEELRRNGWRVEEDAEQEHLCPAHAGWCAK